LISSPPKAQARRSAKADLPLAVGPAMRIADTFVNRIVVLDVEHEPKCAHVLNKIMREKREIEKFNSKRSSSQAP
jgi:hypothetical protein